MSADTVDLLHEAQDVIACLWAIAKKPIDRLPAEPRLGDCIAALNRICEAADAYFAEHVCTRCGDTVADFGEHDCGVDAP
jgi:hypothetical protein